MSTTPLFVIGTAGHIDHGKSRLVEALTGMDPDRLREEKERGMTVDLGFAWLKLPSGREAGMVDVPGHERFIKNMLAGVGAIDLALLVIAANESVMPQTREHLSILDLLAIPRAIVVINKKDLVDEEWLGLVKADIEELLKPTRFAGSPVAAVSALSGEGLPELISLVDRTLAEAPARRDLARPRLPVDRVFTIAGAGTVVTGMLIDGRLTAGQEVEILPAGLKSRLRSLQTHRSPVETAMPGSRVAANIVGIEVSQVKRGDVLAAPGAIKPATILTAGLRLLERQPRPLRHNAEVSVHTGTAEAMAHVRLLDRDELKPGENGWAQLLLDRPLAVVEGDHYIIRSPMDTLGGGEIVSLGAKRLRRRQAETIRNLEARGGSAGEAMAALLETRQPAEVDALVAASNQPPEEARQIIGSLVERGRIIAVGPGERRLLWTAAGWERLKRNAAGAIEDYQRRFPLRPGMPRTELASRLKLGTNSGAVIQKLAGEGTLVEQGNIIRTPDHQPRLTPSQEAKAASFLEALARSPYSPPPDLTLEPEVLGRLVDQGKIVRVGDIVFPAGAYREMVEKTVSAIRQKGKVTLAEVRDMFGTSRKYAQAFLEHLDEKKITRRVGDERVLGKESDRP